MRIIVYASLLSALAGVIVGCKKESFSHSSIVSDSNFSVSEQAIWELVERKILISST